MVDPTSSDLGTVRRLCIVLGLLLAWPCAGQDQHVIDSLQRVLRLAVHDSVRFSAYIEMAGEHLFSTPDTAYSYCQRARTIAARTGRAGDPGEVEGWLGFLEEQRGHVPEAIAHYQRSLEAAEALADSAGISTVLNNLAAIYKDQGLVEQALSAHQRSLAIRYARKDSAGIATSHNNIGLIDYDLGRIPDAMEHYTEALRIYEAIDDAQGTATALHNIAGVYRDQGDLDQALPYFQRTLLINKALGDVYSMAATEDNIGGVLELQQRYSEALVHYERAFALHDQVDDPRGRGYSLRNMASVELKRGKADVALAHADRALDEFVASDDKRGRASALWMKGLAHEKLGDAGAAKQHGLKALELARELGYPQLMRDAAQLLDRGYRAEGRWKDALAMHDLYVIMRDSMLNEDARRSAMRQQFKYTYEKKEAALKAEQERKDLLARERSQREKNERNVAIFIGIGVLLVAIGLWSRLHFVRRSRAAIQKEKDVSEGLLLNILPEEVAKELKSTGRAEAKHFQRATVLFSDFKGFTHIAENMTAAELVQEIDACFGMFDAITDRLHVEKIKTIGDAYMAVGGLPVPDQSSPADVVEAALEMIDAMQARASERERIGLPAFHMRVGMHTGPVVAGIVGVKKFQYDVWGDTVNIASRMESSGEVGRVNISEATYEIVRHDPRFRFIARGAVAAKGKGELQMYFVERA